jgi:hypothetical protein
MPDTTTLFICTLTDGVNTVHDSVNIFVTNPALVNAGPDTLVNAGESYFIIDATAGNYSSVRWSTSGLGSFSDPAIVNTTYTPDTLDSGNGSVSLKLTAFPLGNCRIMTDSLLLTITPYTGLGHQGTIEPYVMFRAPTTVGSLDLLLGNFSTNGVMIALRDISGRMIRQGYFHLSNNPVNTIHFHSLSPGIYIAEIRSKSHHFISKAIVF